MSSVGVDEVRIDGREPAQEPLEVRHDGGDRRLHEHHLRDQDAIRVAIGPPGERAKQRELLARSRIGNAEFDAGLARIRELLPFCTEDRYLVHNDLLNFNVLVDAAGVVLLDWGASLFGDFLYDAALLTFWWPWYRERWGGIDIRGEIERHHARSGTQIPSFAERLRVCELDIGISHIPWQAGRGEWDRSAWTARRTAQLAERDLAGSD